MRRCFLFLFLLALIGGCSTGYYSQGLHMMDRGDYAKAREMFYLELQATPDNYLAWQQIGVAQFKDGAFTQAEEALQKSQDMEPRAITSMYLGLIDENDGNYDHALGSYRAALALAPSRRVGKLVRGHMEFLIQKKLKMVAKEAIAREGDFVPPSDNTIAVVPFDDSGMPVDYVSLCRGFEEFAALDLGKVNQLKVAERLRMDAIVSELNLSASDMVDPQTRLRLGRLVGARHIVTGSMQVIDDENIDMIPAIGNTVTDSLVFPGAAKGSLKGFFKLEKDFVFDVIAGMDIKLTREERDAIEVVPTESYLALMAYCKGLQFQDDGDYQNAARSFNQAAQKDASFTVAEDRAEFVGDVAASQEDFSADDLGTDFSTALAEEIPAVEDQGEMLTVLDPTINSFIPAGEGDSQTAPPDDSEGPALIVISIQAHIPDKGGR